MHLGLGRDSRAVQRGRRAERIVVALIHSDPRPRVWCPSAVPTQRGPQSLGLVLHSLTTGMALLKGLLSGHASRPDV